MDVAALRIRANSRNWQRLFLPNGRLRVAELVLRRAEFSYPPLGLRAAMVEPSHVLKGDQLARLFRAQLPQRTEPIFHVEGFGDLAILDGLNIDRHDLEAFARVGHAEEVAGGRAGHLAAHDDAIAGDEHFLDSRISCRGWSWRNCQSP
jgi:hypothetical protein